VRFIKDAIVTMAVVSALISYSSAQRSAPKVHFSFDNSSFYADGRESEKSEFPSETQINCDRPGKTCIAASAEYYSGHPHVSIEYFRVLKWDADGIIAISDALCMQRTMIVSFPNRGISVSGALKTLPKEKTEACETLGASKPYTDVFVLKNSPQWNKDPYGEGKSK
jgi:hypothetical protein